MNSHEFTLILNAEPDDEQAERLYGIVGDGTLATIAGVPQIQFHRDASSLVDAIRSAIADVRSASLQVARVEIAPDAVLQAS